MFRLCVEDYHRYIYVDDGVKSENVKIPGVIAYGQSGGEMTVSQSIKRIAREFSLLCSENFGTVLMMEVGAMMVGKIENRHQAARVRRGQEKGNFAFGRFYDHSAHTKRKGNAGSGYLGEFSEWD